MVIGFDGQDPEPFNIIAIDPQYKYWAIAYSCTHEWGINKKEKIWVLTRWDKIYKGKLKEKENDWKSVELELLKHSDLLKIGENEHFCFQFRT